MNKKVKKLILGYITIAQFTALSSGVIANAKEVKDTNSAIVQTVEDETDAVEIPDSNLKAALNEKLEQEASHNITKDQLRELAGKLDLSGNSITDITPLAALSNLSMLNLKDNDVESLKSLSGLSKLWYLNLNNNTLKSLEGIKELYKLTELYAENNALEDIEAIRYLKVLYTVNLSNNKIVNIDAIENLEGVRQLMLANNSIVDAEPLANLIKKKKNLYRVNLSDNYIKNVYELKELASKYEIEIDLSNNKVIEEETPKLPEIDDEDSNNKEDNGTEKEEVKSYVTINDIKLRSALNSILEQGAKDDITEEQLASIKGTLDLSNKGITDLTGIEKCINVTQLYIDGNKIEDVSLLSEMSRLSILDASKNRISDMSPLLKLTNLKLLNLKNNQIEEIGEIIGLRLYYLNLANNKISDISDLFNMYGLTELYLEGNSIEDISYLRNIRTLNILNLANNKIEDVSVVWNFTELRHLTLSGNNISDLDPIVQLLNHKDTNNLASINLSNNKITSAECLKGLDKNGAININVASNPIVVEVPEEVSEVIDTDIVTPIWGEGTEEDPIVLNVNEDVTTEKMEEMIQNFKDTNTVCESIEAGAEFTTYKFKVTSTPVSRMLMKLRLMDNKLFTQDSYLSLVVGNEEKELLEVLNKAYEKMTDDATTGDNNKDDSTENSPQVPSDDNNDVDKDDSNIEDEIVDKDNSKVEDEAVSENNSTSEEIAVEDSTSINSNKEEASKNIVESIAAKTGDASSMYLLGTMLASVGALVARKKKNN